MILLNSQLQQRQINVAAAYGLPLRLLLAPFALALLDCCLPLAKADGIHADGMWLCHTNSAAAQCRPCLLLPCVTG